MRFFAFPIRDVVRCAIVLAVFARPLMANAAPAPSGVFLSERAMSSSAFVDSVGVNVHFSYHDGPYGRYTRVNTLLKMLGVRHIRDGVTMGQNDVCREDRAVASLGIHMDFLVQRDLGRAQLAQWADCVGPAIEAYEGLNEYDISHPSSDVDWAMTVRTVQRALYQSVKGTPALAQLTVIGPSLTSPDAFRSVGDLSTAMDFGNMHNYYAGHEPATGGWGMNGYGSLAWNLAAARIIAGSRTVLTTESGYSTGGGGDPRAIDAAAQGIYVPTLFLEQFAAAIPRTYYYELLDEGGAPFSHYGLADGNYAPKPAFFALSELLSLFADNSAPNAGATLPTLRYALSNGDSGTHHVLLAKRDGTLYFVVWQTTSSFDTLTGRPIEVAPRTMTLRLANSFRAATLTTIDAAGKAQSNRVTLSAKALALSVGARPVVVQLDPAP